MKSKKTASSIKKEKSKSLRLGIQVDRNTYINVKKLAVDKGIRLRDILIAGYNSLSEKKA